MLSVRHSFTNGHKSEKYWDHILHCTPWYGRQAQHCELNNACARTSGLSVRLGCLLPQSFRLDGTGEKKKIEQRGTKGSLLSHYVFLQGTRPLSFQLYFLPPRQAKKNTDFFLLKGTTTTTDQNQGNSQKTLQTRRQSHFPNSLLAN